MYRLAVACLVAASLVLDVSDYHPSLHRKHGNRKCSRFNPQICGEEVYRRKGRDWVRGSGSAVAHTENCCSRILPASSYVKLRFYRSIAASRMADSVASCLKICRDLRFFRQSIYFFISPVLKKFNHVQVSQEEDVVHGKISIKLNPWFSSNKCCWCSKCCSSVTKTEKNSRQQWSENWKYRAAEVVRSGISTIFYAY